MQRTTRTEEEKAALVARFEQGGTTAREFCHENGIAYQSFLAWRRKDREGSRSRMAAPAGFIELAVPGAAPEALAAELDLGGGAVVRFFRCVPRP